MDYAAVVGYVDAKLVANQEQIQMREYEKQQADMEKLATFVRVNKANGVAASAKSKKKVLEIGQI